ncbi:hypothetical protein TEA_016083 [Camellia sinensis var. sinensis]|uniref:Uncharacterized protein n=1 Tax=Camellia sinensis var. sinensis TaxID=542762 RepID=A0A4S4DM59_CAMSN|nr:hypothetical protein TEA_016083 [Camellia sinensis var. sinensis]
MSRTPRPLLLRLNCRMKVFHRGSATISNHSRSFFRALISGSHNLSSSSLQSMKKAIQNNIRFSNERNRSPSREKHRERNSSESKERVKGTRGKDNLWSVDNAMAEERTGPTRKRGKKLRSVRKRSKGDKVMVSGAMLMEVETVLQTQEPVIRPAWNTFASSVSGIWKGLGAVFSPITAEMEPIEIGNKSENLYDCYTLSGIEVVPSPSVGKTSQIRRIINWVTLNPYGEIQLLNGGSNSSKVKSKDGDASLPVKETGDGSPKRHVLPKFESFNFKTSDVMEEDLMGMEPGLVFFEDGSYSRGPVDIPVGEATESNYYLNPTFKFEQHLYIARQSELLTYRLHIEVFKVRMHINPDDLKDFPRGCFHLVSIWIGHAAYRKPLTGYDVDEMKLNSSFFTLDDVGGWDQVGEDETNFFRMFPYLQQILLVGSSILVFSNKLNIIHCCHKRLRIVHTIEFSNGGSDIQIMRVAVYEEQWASPANILDQSDLEFDLKPFSQRKRTQPSELTGSWKVFEVSATPIYGEEEEMLTEENNGTPYVYLCTETLKKRNLPENLVYFGEEELLDMQDVTVLWLPGGVTGYVDVNKDGILCIGVGWYSDEGINLVMERDYGVDGKLKEVRSKSEIKRRWSDPIPG